MEQKHKIFISYRHKNEKHFPTDFDKNKKEELEKAISSFCINKSVEEGEYDEDLSDEYIKRLIREEKVSDSSVIIVLCGPETWSRKHVDWEISAGLNDNVKGISGLIGVILPNHPSYSKGFFDPNTIPQRLLDNKRSGYSKIYDWDVFIKNAKTIIEEAFNNRIVLKDKVDNSREQMKINKEIK